MTFDGITSQRSPYLRDNYIDRKGLRCGIITVIERAGTTASGNARWKFLCDCGNTGFRSNFSKQDKNKDIPLNCGCLNPRNTLHGKGKTYIGKMWMRARHRAQDRGVLFNLKLDEMPDMPVVCPILGLELGKNIGNCQDNSPSLDRIIPELGYVAGNVRIISLRANLLKSNATVYELEAILKDAKEIEQTIR